MSRKTMDCRDFPSDSKCTLTISGEDDEVLRAAVLHAVDVHGHKDTPEFRNELKKALKPEPASASKR